MIIDRITAAPLEIPFRTTFVHASASRARTQSVLASARARDGAAGIGEGCPREYVTHESVATALEFVAAHGRHWQASIRDVVTLGHWVERQRRAIDAHPAAWTAVELALLDLIGHAEGRPIESLLGLPPLSGRFRYTAVLGDAPPAAFEAQLAAYRHAGFRDFKIKLCGRLERDLAKASALRAAGIEDAAVRADANNLWRDSGEAVAHLTALGLRFAAIEEPVRAGDFAGMRRVSEALGIPIVLDESMLRLGQLEAIRPDANRWIVNVRVSKMGGLLRSLELAGAARACGVPIIVGAHVGETSVLARAALTLEHGADGSIVGREGAFGTHLLAHDVVTPSIVFGRGGIVDTAALACSATPGLGFR